MEKAGRGQKSSEKQEDRVSASRQYKKRERDIHGCPIPPVAPNTVTWMLLLEEVAKVRRARWAATMLERASMVDE